MAQSTLDAAETFAAASFRACAAALQPACAGAADARLMIVSRTGVEADVEADLLVGPDEIVAAWD